MNKRFLINRMKKLYRIEKVNGGKFYGKLVVMKNNRGNEERK